MSIHSQHNAALEVMVIASEAKKEKGFQIRNMGLLLFADDIVLYRETPKDSTKIAKINDPIHNGILLSY